MESHTASQQKIAAVTEHARQFAESLLNCRSSSAVQDGGQPTLLTYRVDALEDAVQDSNRQMVSVSNKVDTFENLVAAIHNQLKALKESNDKLTSQATRLELSMNSRFTEMESSLDSWFAKMESNIKKMDLSMNSRFQDMNSRVDDLRSDLNFWVRRDDAEK
ncbi:hypothetical protein E4U48_006831 [Claviceps purpurea]|nr:hypothetical protein E4U48_006831 [Claviceps purpurea]